jgi:hypothetical protein
MRPCLQCNRPTHGTYCQAHQPRTDSPSTATRTASERKRRAQAVTEWVMRNGHICPGYNRPPHQSTDLTADHPIRVADGGDQAQPLAILCRTCNSSKG